MTIRPGHQINILEWFLKDHVRLKTENDVCCKFSFAIHHRNKIQWIHKNVLKQKQAILHFYDIVIFKTDLRIKSFNFETRYLALMQHVWTQHSGAWANSVHRASDLLGVTSPTNQRGRLKALSHGKRLLTGAASVITHQLSLKGSSRHSWSCNTSQSTTLKLQNTSILSITFADT